ncbi:MAG: hypothetical protein ACJ0BI_01440 [Paracoccaceae bacterium]
MAHIYKFPALEDIPKKHDPRQRIFYIGHRPAGVTPQDGIQHVYLRKGCWEDGKRKWSVISYEEEIEFGSGSTYEEIWEWDSCEENEVILMLDDGGLAGQYTLKDLRDMGWEGKSNVQAKIYYLPEVEGL